MLSEQPRIPIRSILLYGLWPTFIKVFLYRLKGYRIGKGVSIGLGAVICGEQVEVGDYTSIGFFTIIRGKTIQLGSHVHIASLTFLDTPHIQIGEGSNINEQVFVGGLQYPDSRFTVGRNCSIMQLSFINPARPIVIGDGCVIGGHCLIFTHSSSLNHFEGYPVDFAPIEIGNGVGLAWRVFVLPGAKIGDGTMVGANSLVAGTLPPHSMAVGYPARVVGRPPVFPKPVSDEEKRDLFRKICQEMIDYLIGMGLECRRDGDSCEIRVKRRWRRAKQWRLQMIEEDIRCELKRVTSSSPHVLVSLQEIPDDVRHFLAARGVLWIDIARKERSPSLNDLAEEVLAFLKRYGVRTSQYRNSSDPSAIRDNSSRPDMAEHASL